MMPSETVEKVSLKLILEIMSFNYEQNCRCHSIDLVRWLLSLNPSAVNAANSFGRTCLHLAAMNANIELCKLLLDHGASINALMKQRGFIPEKMSQSQQLQSPSTNVNLSAGRKAACFGVSMVTPLDLALQRGNRNCARFLMLNGAFPAARLGLNW